MSTPLAVEVADLHHAFKRHQALRGVTFAVEPGSIHGFVGPNGAGKTTVLKVLATLLRPQKGVARVFGDSVTRDLRSLRRKIGYMPDHLGMYPQMTVYEYVDFFAAAYGQGAETRRSTVRGVLTLTDMLGRRDDLIQGLSRGMQQRVALARTLVHDPQLLLLDEPASGLDPRARLELIEILRELQRLGKTIVLSSHILSEIAVLCDAVTIVDRGLVKYTGRMNDLLQGRQGGEHELRLLAPHAPLAEVLRALPGVREVSERDPLTYAVVGEDGRPSGNEILRAVLASGAEVAGFERRSQKLDEVFLDLTEPGVRE